MNLPQSSHSKTIKVILTFLGTGAFGGICFALIVTRTSYRHLWFSKREWWSYPTWKYWLTAVLFLIGALVLAYIASLRQGWVTSAKGSRVVAFLLLGTIFPSLTWLVEYIPAYGFIFVPIVVAALVSLALLALTGVWDRRVAILILVACLIRTPLASIPDLLMTQSMPGVWFDALRYFILLSCTSCLAGYWLVRSEVN